MATGGASSTGTRPPTGGTVPTGGSSSRGDAGVYSDGGPPPPAYLPCSVSIDPADRPSLLSLLPGDTATLTVKGTIAWGTLTATQPTWLWTIKGPDGTLLETTLIPTGERDTALVKFPLRVPGRYDISVSVSPSSCKGHASATAVKPQDNSQSFFIRVLPPPAAATGSGQTCRGLPRWCPSEDAVPYENKNFVLQAGQARHDEIQLTPGYAVSIDPAEVAQTNSNAFPAIAIPSFVRISPRGSTWTLDGESSINQPLRALLDSGLTYDILVIPQIDASTKVFPPFLVASKWAQDFQSSDFNVTSGVTVQGTLRGPAGPAKGARLLLRADPYDPVTLPLPSTVGSADSTGAYSLRASARTLFSAVVVPPPDMALPQVTIIDSVDLQASANGAIFTGVDFTWNVLSTTTMSLRVLLSDNSTPAASVTVRLQSQDGAFPDVGVLTVAGSQTGAASGSMRREGTTDANGSVVFSDIPKIAYHLTLIPPGDTTGAAITTGSIDLAGAPASITRTLSLGRKVKLSGLLSPANAASGARLVATDTGTDVLVSIISTQVASDGSYEFLADPERDYRFSVEPAAGSSLPARIPLYGITTTKQDTQLAERTLPLGLKVSGVVTFKQLPVAGAIVQAYCEQQGIAGCVDPANPTGPLPPPLVEFATLPDDGSYSFYLLDPATGGGYTLP